MKLLHTSNLILVGLLLLAVFFAAMWLVGVRMDRTANGMHRSMEREVGHYRSELVRLDFRRTEALEGSVQDFLEKNGYDKEKLSDFLTSLLSLDAKVSRIWFFSGEDGVVCRDSVGAEDADGELRGVWKDVADSFPEGGGSGLYREGGVLYWTLCGRSRGVVYGFDISLPDLHTYFAGMSPMVRSYAFILNEAGVLVTHPDEKLVGKSLTDNREIENVRRAIRDDAEVLSVCFSDFLFLPVERVYYPIPVGGETWVVAVNILQLDNQEEMDRFHRYAVLISIVMVLVFGILLAFSQYKWRREYDLRRKAERQALELNMQQLKNQINPHFLFNSLNSLGILIGSDDGLAKEFVLKLSKVYRYLLEKRNENLATVADELEFARHYYFLQKIRFGEQLTLEAEVDPSVEACRIPLLSLQMLMENAIKHNEVTRKHPLRIQIYSSGDRIFVVNNYQPRADTPSDSMGVGFENIREIYAYYSKGKFEYRIDGAHFICELPLI